MWPLKTIELLATKARAESATRQNDAQDVASPCVSVCRMAEGTGWRQGCLRNLDEIAHWGHADAAYKRAVWSRIQARAAQLTT
ncbi:hypothetical protein GALL_511990 [mine drainage metagenome]|uniref:Uncharacterized protein n=1 Tax=mine drainage metagenome TaxID=410659 RepID=A0A1J5PHE7_9ZZZZ